MTHAITGRRWAGALAAAFLLTLTGALVAGCSGEATPSSSAASTQTSAARTTPSSAAAWVTVDVQQTYERLKADTAAQIVDVREPDEWAATGVAPGAVLIPLGQLEQRAPGELAKDKPVYVICNSGNRSQTGSDTLVALGYTQVFNVGGGIQAWLKAGLPVDTYKP